MLKRLLESDIKQAKSIFLDVKGIFNFKLILFILFKNV